MNRFPVIPPFLLIPPVAVRIAELAFLARRIDVASVLEMGNGNLKVVSLGVGNRERETTGGGVMENEERGRIRGKGVEVEVDMGNLYCVIVVRSNE